VPKRAVSSLIIASVLWGGTAAADEVADFYRGKTVSLIISNAAGGGYDVLARALAPYLAKYIPGNPTIIVQNMPGAGGLLGVNYLYNLAAKDGSVIGGISNTVPFEPLNGTSEARFDPLAFNWLGSPTVETGMLIVWHTVPVDSITDAKTRETTIASTGTKSTPSFYARLLNQTLGTKLKIIVGYPGQNEMYHAMESGEVDGSSSVFYSSLMATRPTWLREKKIKVLVQYGLEKHPDLPDVPFAADLAGNSEDVQLIQAAVAPLGVGRPYAMPPGVPATRIGAVRQAFEKALHDSEFIARAESLQIDLRAARNGDQVRDIIQRAYSVSPQVVTRLRGL
jgi:tripartite-type tricarboxylate transporter receptor subunit TctC